MTNRAIRGLHIAPLREARKRKRWSRANLHRISDVAERTIANIEDETVEPNIETIAKLAAALKISMVKIIRVPYAQRTLADLRHLAGYSQTTLARKAGLSPNTISALERGEIQLTDDKTALLTPLLKTTPNQLRLAWLRAKNRAPDAPA